jgi:hypothetical protein
MHFFPGVAWDAWEDMPYQLVLDCLDWIDARLGNAEGGDV